MNKNRNQNKNQNKNQNMKKNSLKGVMLRALVQHKFRSVMTLATIAVSIVLEVLPPLVLARAVDALTENRMVSVLLAAGYFVLLACSGLTDAVREAMIVMSGEGITHALRSTMMQKLHRLPAAYFTDHEAGKTASIQVNDVDAIEEMFTSGLVSMFTDLGTVISMLAVIFTRSVGLGILLLIALPLLSAFTAHVQKKMLAAHTENRRATAQANGILPETMHIMRSIHVYHAGSFAERRYDAAISDSFQALERTNFYDAIYSPVILTVSAAVIGVMMSLSGQSGAFRSLFGMSVGTAVALIAYVNNIFTPLSSIGMEIQTVQSAAAGWKRVQTFLNEKERVMPDDFSALAKTGRNAAQEEERAKADPDEAIGIRDVTFSYDAEHPVLKNFSLSVRKGEFVTLTGRTGVGKSTLFKLLLGLYEPDSGTIRIDGTEPQQLSDDRRRSVICCVEQKVSPVPGTIRDQVTLGNNAIPDEAVRKALETADLMKTVEAVPGQLDAPYQDALFSQGQRQLLMIARAIVSDPDILLLDEITAGLDTATEKVIVGALLKASQNRTVLSISHRLSQAMPGRMVDMKEE